MPNTITMRQLRREAIALVHALRAHSNAAKANKLIAKAQARVYRRDLNVKHGKYPSYKVIVPA